MVRANVAMRRAYIFVLWLLLPLCAGAEAAAFTHVVQKGDTLAGIAERYYGRIQYEQLLVAANLLDSQGGSPIRPGMRLEIPALGHRRVHKTDTWASLAQELLGQASRSDVLAIANGTNPWLPPPNGAEIVVPYNLTLIAAGDENIVQLAYRFLGDKNKAWVLDRYNDLRGRAIRRGDVLLIPLSDLPLTKEGKQAARAAAADTCSQGEGQTLDAQRRVQAELPALLSDVRSGRYVEAVRRGSQFLSSGELTEPQLAVIHRQLLESYAALEAHGLAALACAEWRKHDPKAMLDPARLSPKIIRACEAAKAVAPPTDAGAP